MNPVLPREHFVPDGEAHVMPDGRLYVYGSYDLSGRNGYCSQELHVFSTDDLIHWTDHGVAFRSCDVPWAPEGADLYAPDCIHRDGKYYLYFCMSSSVEGVAVADRPWGPFTDPKPIRPADGDSIDPAIFVDNDGQAYYFWGQFSLRGAKMNEDMTTLDMSSLSRCVIDEKRHGFHEGASMRRRGDLYYLTYTDITRGRATCIGYAVSRSPLGPFEYKGVIVDNIGCDPQTWNNHGSIEEFKGRWYVFYHRSSQNSVQNRRLCIEPIGFDESGDIREVLPTTQGVEPPLSVMRPIAAADACRMGGWGAGAYIMPDEEKGREILTDVRGNGWAVYRYVDFDAPVSECAVEYRADGKASFEIWAGDVLIGKTDAEPTDGAWREACFPVESVCGVHALYVEWKMEKGGRAELRTIRFGQREKERG